MLQAVQNNDSLIDANDILEVISQHNFPNKKQIDLLQILDFILFKKNYPQKICGIFKRKIKLLKRAEWEQDATEKDNFNVASIKVRSIIILELLRRLQLGPAQNDLSKICKLIAFLTGNSYNTIYNEMQKGISFSKFHSQQIAEANEIFKELNASISIDINRQY